MSSVVEMEVNDATNTNVVLGDVIHSVIRTIRLNAT